MTKKSLLILSLIMILNVAPSAFAENYSVKLSQGMPVSYVRPDFSKTYKTSAENLMYLLLSAINDLNYSIEEIQFKSGCVLFKAYSKEFIASVVTGDGYLSFLNIIPADNNYNFQPALIEKLQRYIELNSNTSFQKVI